MQISKVQKQIIQFSIYNNKEFTEPFAFNYCFNKCTTSCMKASKCFFLNASKLILILTIFFNTMFKKTFHIYVLGLTFPFGAQSCSHPAQEYSPLRWSRPTNRSERLVEEALAMKGGAFQTYYVTPLERLIILKFPLLSSTKLQETWSQ